jgi:hypothetical protein
LAAGSERLSQYRVRQPLLFLVTLRRCQPPPFAFGLAAYFGLPWSRQPLFIFSGKLRDGVGQIFYNHSVLVANVSTLKLLGRLLRHPLSGSLAINDNEKRLIIVAQLLSFVLVAIAQFPQALLSGTTPRQFGLQIDQIRESE